MNQSKTINNEGDIFCKRKNIKTDIKVYQKFEDEIEKKDEGS